MLKSFGSSWRGWPLLAVLLVAALASAPHVADADGPSLRIEPREVQAAIRSDFRVEVVIEDVENLGFFQFDLNFDPAMIQVKDATLGDFLGSTGRSAAATRPIINNPEGNLIFGGFSFGNEAGPDGDGVLAVVVLNGIADGESTLSLANVKVLDVESNQMETTVSGGTIAYVGAGAAGQPTATPTSPPTDLPTSAATTTAQPTASSGAATATLTSAAGTPQASATPTAVAATQPATPSPSPATTAASTPATTATAPAAQATDTPAAATSTASPAATAEAGTAGPEQSGAATMTPDNATATSGAEMGAPSPVASTEEPAPASTATAVSVASATEESTTPTPSALAPRPTRSPESQGTQPERLLLGIGAGGLGLAALAGVVLLVYLVLRRRGS